MAHEEVEEAELRDGEWVGVGVEVDGAEKKETDGKDRQRGWGGLVKGWGGVVALTKMKLYVLLLFGRSCAS